MRIIVYTHNYLPTVGGIATYCRELCTGLAEMGIDVTLLAPMEKALIHENLFGISSLPRRFSHDRIGTTGRLKACKYVRNVIASKKPDVILACSSDAIYISAMTDVTPASLAIMVHGSEISKNFPFRSIPTWIRSRLIKRALTKAGCILTPSNYTQNLIMDRIRSLPVSKITTVHHGLKPDRIRQTKPVFRNKKTYKLLSVGRMIEFKGFHLFPAILSELQKMIPNVEWSIAGSGPYKTKIENAAKKTGVYSSITFLGDVPYAKMGEMYHVFDLLVHPTIVDKMTCVESFGFIIIEAMRAGCPVAAAPHGGIPELISDGETGIFIDVFNPAKAGAKIADLLNQPDLRANIAVNGQERVTSYFNTRRMTDSTLAVLKSIEKTGVGND